MSRQFNGSSFLSGGNADYFPGMTALTLAAWVYRPSSGTTIVTLASGFNSLHLFELTWFNSDNKIYLDVRNGATDAVASTASTLFGWHFIAGTWDGALPSGSRGAVYLNGINVTASQSAMPTSISNNLSARSLRLGNLESPSIFSSNNTRLGDTLAFNAAATPSQIKEMMWHPYRYAGLTTCLNYWRLNNDGTTQPDIAGRRSMNANTTAHSTTQPPVLFGF